jgi:hypothetical protein
MVLSFLFRPSQAQLEHEYSREDREEDRHGKDQEHEREEPTIMMHSMRTGIYCRISQDSEGDELGVNRQKVD